MRPGQTHSAEARERMSAAKRGKVLSAETRERMSAAKRGKVLSAETRERMSAAQRGKVLSAETRERISAAQRRSLDAFFAIPDVAALVRRMRADGHGVQVIADRLGVSSRALTARLLDLTAAPNAVAAMAQDIA